MIATENLQYVAAGVIAAPLVIIVGAEAAAAAGAVAAAAKTVASAAVRIHTGYTWVARLVDRLRSRVKSTDSNQPPGDASSGLSTNTQQGSANDVFHVTPSGIVLPKGPNYQIPRNYVENPNRTGSYGELVNGRFVERLRVDSTTPPGIRGPNHSHYHLNGKGAHYSPRPSDRNPGFDPHSP